MFGVTPHYTGLILESLPKKRIRDEDEDDDDEKNLFTLVSV